MSQCSFCPEQTDNEPSYTGAYFCDTCQDAMETYFHNRAEGIANGDNDNGTDNEI